MRISDWSSDVCSSDLYTRSSRRSPAIPELSAISRSLVTLSSSARSFKSPCVVTRAERAGFFNLPLGMTRTVFGSAISVRGISATGSLTDRLARSEEHTSELQSLMRLSYAVFCLKKQNNQQSHNTTQ